MGKRKVAEAATTDEIVTNPISKSKKTMNNVAKAVVKKAFKLNVEHCKSW